MGSERRESDAHFDLRLVARVLCEAPPEWGLCPATAAALAAKSGQAWPAYVIYEIALEAEGRIRIWT